MSKYEERGGLSDHELPYYRSAVAAIAERLPDRRARLLDVGSAGGDTLALFGELGFVDLTGFDPSPRCAEIARDRYGLRVINTPISKMAFAEEKFDVVLLAGVLEHLRDLRGTICELSGLLSTGGAFWFAVPDARRFSQYVQAPYQHFSLEHINFFTRESLQALLAATGFQLVDAWNSVHHLGAMPEPVLNAVFRSAHDLPARGCDAEGAEAVRRYASASRRVEDRLFDNVRKLVEERTPVIVWSTGSLTLHLMATDCFRDLNVVAYVDGNSNYWNKSIDGVPVVAPTEIRQRRETILVVSYSYQDQIAAQIREVYKVANPVVKLFDVPADRETELVAGGSDPVLNPLGRGI